MSPSTLQRIRATLRSALNSAKKRRLVHFNAAVDLELPTAPRPRVHPWEGSELGQFLDYVARDRMGILYEVIAFTGLRRGEALALRWADVEPERGVLTVRQQMVQISDGRPCVSCGLVHKGFSFGRPKTESGGRIVELDESTRGALLIHRLTQDREREQLGAGYRDHGLVFAHPDGMPVSPDYATKRFAALVREAGLRPVRLHDLRHGAASLMLAADVELAVISKRLGHSSLAITADTYS